MRFLIEDWRTYLLRMKFDLVLSELKLDSKLTATYKILRQNIWMDISRFWSKLFIIGLPQTAHWWFLILIHLRNSQMKSIYANFSKCFVADSAWIFFIQKGTVILWDKGPLFTYEVNHDIIYNLIILRWLYKAKICKTTPTTEYCT